MTTINYEAEVDQDLTAIGKELEKDLYNSEAWAAKADILCSIMMHEIAIRCCDRSLAINPDNMLTWMTRCIALEKIGKHEEAKAAFAKAKELGGGTELLDVVIGLWQ
jgi:tetratricopeptide (TPR) repeat protein